MLHHLHAVNNDAECVRFRSLLKLSAVVLRGPLRMKLRYALYSVRLSVPFKTQYKQVSKDISKGANKQSRCAMMS